MDFGDPRLEGERSVRTSWTGGCGRLPKILDRVHRHDVRLNTLPGNIPVRIYRVY